MLCTVAVPTVQSLLRSGAARLPFGLRHVGAVVYSLSLVGGLVLLFG